MADSERQREKARRWVAASLMGALALLGLGIRYAPRAPPPARRRPRATVHSATPTAPDEPSPEAPARDDAPPIPPWLFFVLPKP